MGKPATTFIAADPPKPPTGGGTRTFHFVKSVAGISTCNLFVLFPVKKEDLPVTVLDSCYRITCSVTAFPANLRGRISGFINDARLLLAPWSLPKNDLILTASYFITNAYNGKNFFRKVFLFLLKHSLTWYVLFLYRLTNSLPVKTLERINQFKELQPGITKSVETSDILWIDFSSLLPFFPDIKNDHASLKLICNAHNIEYLLLERLGSLSKNKLERRWYKCQAAIMKKIELKGFADCDLIITCSDEDRDAILSNLPDARVEVIPNGVDIDFFVPNSLPDPEPTLLFTGTMGYEPNRSAVEYFVEKILPFVIKTYPTCTFIIAGANAAEVFNKYSANKHVEIISSPADMRPVYDRAWVVATPLLTGSGTRLKILEAMAMEKPVVSTSIGAEGIRVQDTIQLFIADDEQEFAERIKLLIENKFIADNMIKAAKGTILNSYSWQKINEKTVSAVLQLV